MSGSEPPLTGHHIPDVHSLGRQHGVSAWDRGHSSASIGGQFHRKGFINLRLSPGQCRTASSKEDESQRMETDLLLLLGVLGDAEGKDEKG